MYVHLYACQTVLYKTQLALREENVGFFTSEDQKIHTYRLPTLL